MLWIRLQLARVLNWLCPESCWVDLYEWAIRNRDMQDVNWDCRDAEISKQPRCWCGKKCSRTNTVNDA